jgi:hypothetical protein
MYTLASQEQMAKKVRPPEDQRSGRFQMRVSPNFLKVIDDWRRKQPDIPSRNEAIMRLVERSLASEPTGVIKPKRAK